MGRLRYMLYQLARVLPKGYRKPVYVVTSVLGVMIFINFMIGVTHSPYLIEVQSAINTLLDIYMNNGGMPLFILLVCLVLYWCSVKHYKELKAAISFCYLMIFVLSFLPMLLGR